MLLRKMILTFLYKYFFILKAAAEGWKICYDGGDKFSFSGHIKSDRFKNVENFIENYKPNLIMTV